MISAEPFVGLAVLRWLCCSPHFPAAQILSFLAIFEEAEPASQTQHCSSCPSKVDFSNMTGKPNLIDFAVYRLFGKKFTKGAAADSLIRRRHSNLVLVFLG